MPNTKIKRTRLLPSLLSSRNTELVGFLMTSLIALCWFGVTEGQLRQVAAVGVNGTSDDVILIGVCDDTHSDCTLRGINGECETDPADMLVNCPFTCNSCLPSTPSECNDKGDPDSCFLGAILGECEANPSYYLRFCAAACSEFLPACSLQTRNFGFLCEEASRSLRTPDFDCGPNVRVDTLRQARSRWLSPVTDVLKRGIGRSRVSASPSKRRRRLERRPKLKKAAQRKTSKRRKPLKELSKRRDAAIQQTPSLLQKFQKMLKVIAATIETKRSNGTMIKRQKNMYQEKTPKFCERSQPKQESCKIDRVFEKGCKISKLQNGPCNLPCNCDCLETTIQRQECEGGKESCDDVTVDIQSCKKNDNSCRKDTIRVDACKPKNANCPNLNLDLRDEEDSDICPRFDFTKCFNHDPKSCPDIIIKSRKGKQKNLHFIGRCCFIISKISADNCKPIHVSEKTNCLEVSEGVNACPSLAPRNGKCQLVTVLDDTTLSIKPSECKPIYCNVSPNKGRICKVSDLKRGYIISPCSPECLNTTIQRQPCEGGKDYCDDVKVDIKSCQRDVDNLCRKCTIKVDACKSRNANCPNLNLDLRDEEDSDMLYPCFDLKKCFDLDPEICPAIIMKSKKNKQKKLHFIGESCFNISKISTDNCKPIHVSEKTNCLEVSEGVNACPSLAPRNGECQLVTVLDDTTLSIKPSECKPIYCNVSPNKGRICKVSDLKSGYIISPCSPECLNTTIRRQKCEGGKDYCDDVKIDIKSCQRDVDNLCRKCTIKVDACKSRNANCPNLNLDLRDEEDSDMLYPCFDLKKCFDLDPEICPAIIMKSKKNKQKKLHFIGESCFNISKISTDNCKPIHVSEKTNCLEVSEGVNACPSLAPRNGECQLVTVLDDTTLSIKPSECKPIYCNVSPNKGRICKVSDLKSGYIISPCSPECLNTTIRRQKCEGGKDYCDDVKVDIKSCQRDVDNLCRKCTIKVDACKSRNANCPHLNLDLREEEDSNISYPCFDLKKCFELDQEICPAIIIESKKGKEKKLHFISESCFNISKISADNCNPIYVTEKTNCLEVSEGVNACPVLKAPQSGDCQSVIVLSNRALSVKPQKCSTIPTAQSSPQPPLSTPTLPTIRPTPEPTTTTNEPEEELLSPETLAALTIASTVMSTIMSQTNAMLLQQILQQLNQANQNNNQNNENNGQNDQNNQDDQSNQEDQNAMLLQQILQQLNQANQNNNQNNENNGQNDQNNQDDQTEVNNDQGNQDDQSNIQSNNNNQNADSGNNQGGGQGSAGDSSSPDGDVPSTPADSSTIIPNCEAEGYMSLVEGLQGLVGQDTGLPLPPETFDIVDAMNFCQHGSGGSEVPSMAEDILKPDGNIEPPPEWLGISSPINIGARSKRRTEMNASVRNQIHHKQTKISSGFKESIIGYGGWIPVVPMSTTSPRLKEREKLSQNLLFHRRKKQMEISTSQNRYSDIILVIDNSLYKNPPVRNSAGTTKNVKSTPQFPIEVSSSSSQSHIGVLNGAATSTQNTAQTMAEENPLKSSIFYQGSIITEATKLHQDTLLTTSDQYMPPNVTESTDTGKSDPYNLHSILNVTESSLTADLEELTGDTMDSGESQEVVTAAASLTPSHGQSEIDEMKKEEIDEEIREEEDTTDEENNEQEFMRRGIFFCGGTLITQRHILTAAHCVIPRKPNLIRLGERDFSLEDESKTVDYRIEIIAVYPEYRFPTKYNDIAIITLKENIPLNSGLVPSCIPPSKLDLPEGLTATVSGWGALANEKTSDLLVDVEVKVRSQQKCNESYYTLGEVFTLHYPNGITDSMVCAAGEGGADVCRGDSGGPLFLKELLQVAGVVSAGFGCGDENFPGLYTRVDSFLTWIDLAIYGRCASPIR